MSVPVTYSANTNVGAVSASATFAGDASHAGSTGSGSFAITPAASTTAVICTPSVTYAGVAIQACSATVSGVGGLSAAVPVVYGANTNVGAASASASYAGDANHAGSSATGSFAITAAGSITTVSCPASVTVTGTPIAPCSATVVGRGRAQRAGRR